MQSLLSLVPSSIHSFPVSNETEFRFLLQHENYITNSNHTLIFASQEYSRVSGSERVKEEERREGKGKRGEGRDREEQRKGEIVGARRIEVRKEEVIEAEDGVASVACVQTCIFVTMK